MGMKLIRRCELVDLWSLVPELHSILNTGFTHRGMSLEFRDTVSGPLKTFFTDNIVCNP